MKNLLKQLIIFVLLLFFAFSPAQAKIGKSMYKIVEDPSGIFVVEINTTRAKNRIVPYIVDELETNDEVFKKTGAKLSVNAGFFDPKNKKTVSYIVIDKKLVANPQENESLMQNAALKDYLDKILNRSEFRILENNEGKIKYDIALHKDDVPEGYVIKHSIQAGPMLIPDLNLEKEFFILVKDGKIISESASALHKYSRTAIGIKNNNIYLFIITNENPMTLEEVAKLAQKWGMEKAMAFDGGGSTSFAAKEIKIISEKDDQARKLKSFLILK